MYFSNFFTGNLAAFFYSNVIVLQFIQACLIFWMSSTTNCWYFFYLLLIWNCKQWILGIVYNWEVASRHKLLKCGRKPRILNMFSKFSSSLDRLGMQNHRMKETTSGEMYWNKWPDLPRSGLHKMLLDLRWFLWLLIGVWIFGPIRIEPCNFHETLDHYNFLCNSSYITSQLCDYCLYN